MLAFARRPEPQRRPIGEPGITDEQYQQFTARLRESGKVLKTHDIPERKFARCSDAITKSF